MQASPFQAVMESCNKFGRDHACVAFIAYDTCGPESPIRNCAPGVSLFSGVLSTFLGIPIHDSKEVSVALRSAVRDDLMSPDTLPPPAEGVPVGDLMSRGQMMRSFMKSELKLFFSRIPGDSREAKLDSMWRGKVFLMDVMPDGGVGIDVFRDPALEALRRSLESGTLTETGGWDAVRFPIVFHLQWDMDTTKSGKPRMLFHTTFEPWRMAVGLAMALCGPRPPVQVRETPYRDPSASGYQAPRKYIIDWDLYVEENLGKAGPIDTFTEDFLLDMFVRSLAVIHAYMRKAGVLPANRRLCMSIKSRTRRSKNKAGRDDTKCSYHATVHIMEPASRHKTVISKILEMVKKDKPSAYRAMVEKDGLKRGIESPGR